MKYFHLSLSLQADNGEWDQRVFINHQQGDQNALCNLYRKIKSKLGGAEDSKMNKTQHAQNSCGDLGDM